MMTTPAGTAQQHDLVIRNARVHDGTGAAGYDADLAVDGDRIVAIGGSAGGSVGDGRLEIDANGRALTPGFVDVHTHDDTALLVHPGLEFKLSQGCTSLVIGNCGFSAIPSGASLPLGPRGGWGDLDGFANDVAERGPACNWITLVGHNTVRAVVMGDPPSGDTRREPTAVELETMRAHVRSAMEQGACGFSSGLVYTPGRWAHTDELVALASEAAPFGGLYTTHMRNEGDRLLEAVDEAITVARQARTPLQISHHKAAGKRNWGRVAASLAKIDAAARDGLDVTLDVYPYIAGSGPMIQYFDMERIDEELAAVMRIASCPAHRHYESRMVLDIATERNATLTETVRHILLAPEGEKTICIQFLMDEADIETNYRHERVMVGSDGIPDLKGNPHPRLFGTFPRVLAWYVRERNVLGFDDALRKMTSMPADRFGLRDRGRVAAGQFADLVLLDPASVRDEATWDEPKREASGITHVIVNGRVAFDASLGAARHTNASSGRFLRYQP